MRRVALVSLQSQVVFENGRQLYSFSPAFTEEPSRQALAFARLCSPPAGGSDVACGSVALWAG